MIRLLDRLLRDLLSDLPGDVTDANQIRFQPPDEEMRNYVHNTLKKSALSVFLADVRDNRKLRTNDVLRRVERGDVIAEPPPDRFDCHYLITAWGLGQASPMYDPTPDEHHLLYAALQKLQGVAPLNPRRIYGTGALALASWPPSTRDMDLPTTVLTVEGFSRFAELWHGMGASARWKPALHLVVTLPVLRKEIPEGPMVTTQVTRYLIDGAPDSAEYRILIGGQVTGPAGAGGDRPVVAGAWVGMETLPAPGRLVCEAVSDENGRFLLEWALEEWPRPTKYRLHAGAEGVGEVVRDLYIPSDSAEYDLQLNP